MSVRATVMAAHDQLEWQLPLNASRIDIGTVRVNVRINTICLRSNAYKSAPRIKVAAQES